MANRKPRILFLCDYYLPGYKSGGGMRTIVNIVDRLGDNYDFKVVTRDHDGKLDRASYEGVTINDWNDVGSCPVFYLAKDDIRFSKVKELIAENKPDVIYCNSYFSTLAIYVLKLRKLRLIPYLPIVVAPCGELSVGALSSKSSKKQVFMKYAKLIRLYGDVIWKASTEEEGTEIREVAGMNAKVFVAPDLSPAEIFPAYNQQAKPEKEPGSVKIVFLSRFHRKKNFNWLFRVLSLLKGRVVVDIIGPLEDKEYWAEAEAEIAKLPENVSVNALGSIPHPEIALKLAEYHFSINPTLGENFGHIFLEALASGCPLIISDRTPWTKLEEKGVGWDISLSEPLKWKDVIEFCANLDQESYTVMSTAARDYSLNWLADEKLPEDTSRLLEYAVSRAGA